MADPSLTDRRSLVQEWIRRFVTYTDAVTWFGGNSVMRAWAEATAALVLGAYQLYVALIRRFTLAAKGDSLSQVTAERGTPRLPGARAKLLVILRPETANVSAITNAATSLVEVDDSSSFSPGDSVRIRNGDGTVSDVRAIIAITTGTGPGGGDELEVALLAGVYTPGADDVDVLFRASVPEGTTLSSSVGVTFQTLEAVITGDANPVLDGEGLFVGLADKVWCEATTSGVSGNIDPGAVTALSTPIPGVKSIYNPEPGTGGTDEETDPELRYRTIHYPTLANRETLVWIEALLRQGDRNVLRAVTTAPSGIGSMAVKVLHRNGGTFTAAQLAALVAYAEDRVRSHLTVEVSAVTLTSVEVEARITLEPGATLEGCWQAASSRLATYLDFRRWAFGGAVDNADLLSLVNTTPGVATLDTGSFLPSSSVTVGAESLPTLIRLSLEDTASGDTLDADLAVTF